MRKVYLTHGLPGSGKSFRAKQLLDEFGGIILSTDNFWIRPNGLYDFRIDLLGQAHQWNQKRFEEEIDKRTNNIIVDNTNISWKECKPYATYAIQNGYTVEIVEPKTPWKYDLDECAKRNTHRVTKEIIENMWSRWQTSEHIISQMELLNGNFLLRSAD